MSRRAGDFCDGEAGVRVARGGVGGEWRQDWAVFLTVLRPAGAIQAHGSRRIKQYGADLQPWAGLHQQLGDLAARRQQVFRILAVVGHRHHQVVVHGQCHLGPREPVIRHPLPGLPLRRSRRCGACPSSPPLRIWAERLPVCRVSVSCQPPGTGSRARGNSPLGRRKR